MIVFGSKYFGWVLVENEAASGNTYQHLFSDTKTVGH